jgi:hypothetical protein
MQKHESTSNSRGKHVGANNKQDLAHRLVHRMSPYVRMYQLREDVPSSAQLISKSNTISRRRQLLREFTPLAS